MLSLAVELLYYKAWYFFPQSLAQCHSSSYFSLWNLAILFIVYIIYHLPLLHGECSQKCQWIYLFFQVDRVTQAEKNVLFWLGFAMLGIKPRDPCARQANTLSLNHIPSPRFWIFSKDYYSSIVIVSKVLSTGKKWYVMLYNINFFLVPLLCILGTNFLVIKHGAFNVDLV